MHGSSQSVSSTHPDYQFRRDTSFPTFPEDGIIGEVPGVAVDAHDRVHVGNRSTVPVQIFDSDGNHLSNWDYSDFSRVHSITVAPDGLIYIADDRRHTVRVFDSDGALVRTLGTPGIASDTGVGEAKPWIVKQAGPPFNLPTDVAVAPDGTLYVSDGYGNARVHHFDSEGTLLHSWGEPGSGPGQFNLPHGVTVDEMGRVLVADRENGRIQVFSPEGEYLNEIGDLHRPCNMCLDGEGNIFVAELAPAYGRITIVRPDGEKLAQWTIEGDIPSVGAHSVALDSSGNLYVGLVFQGAPLPPDAKPVLKYVRTG